MKFNVLIKSIGSSIKFRYFEESILKKTWHAHSEILDWASSFLENDLLPRDRLVLEGQKLRQTALKEFNLKYQDDSRCTIFIHVPEKSLSPGGYSVFNGYVNAFNFMGCKAYSFSTKSEFQNLFKIFKPNLILASDNNHTVQTIDWDILNELKSQQKVLVGLTASSEEDCNELNLSTRIERSLNNGVDFFYSFKSPEYCQNSISFSKYHKFNLPVFSIEFGCNPMYHYPVQIANKDLDYIFLASSNIDKREKYYKWLPLITKNYFGFIDGPGWHKIEKISSFDIHRFLYSRAKLGLNLHIENSMQFESELNERTYILASCGVPQLVDNAMLLSKRFSSESMFIASNPKEYYEHFLFMINNPEECEKRALIALQEVFAKHTIFLRLDSFLNDLFNFYKL